MICNGDNLQGLGLPRSQRQRLTWRRFCCQNFAHDIVEHYWIYGYHWVPIWNILNYFTSSDPHHDIYTFCYWQIFCHIVTPMAYLLAFDPAFYLAYLLVFYLANIPALYLAYLLAFYLTSWLAFYLAYLLAFYLAYLLAFYLAYLLALYLTFYLASLLAFYLAVEVERCTLSWEGPRLRSSGAHWARTLAKSLAKSWQGNSGRGSGGRGGGGDAGGGGAGGAGAG